MATQKTLNATRFKGFSTTDPHQAFVIFVVELVGILVLAFVADASENAGYVILAVLAALWLLYFINNGDALASLLSKLTGG